MERVSAPPLRRTEVLKTRRDRSIDNLKVALVAGVIAGHTTMAWTGVGTWVFDEPVVGEPLLTVATLAVLLGGMFGMAAFFFIAGMYTAPSLARKGPLRFLIDRLIRLGVPMLFFIIFLSPLIEYADPDAAGWDRGFWAFTLHIWWPPAPGPTWFLGVLLLFSAAYALFRALRPRRTASHTPLRLWHLVLAVMLVAVSSYLVRLAVPFGVEVWRLALGQAPAWIVGFGLGVIGGERGWFDPIPDRISKVTRRGAWVAIAALVTVGALAADLIPYGGGGTAESAIAATIEGVLVVTMPLWLIDLFRRRYRSQGRLLEAMSRAAFAAFVLHQLVLVALVLASHSMAWAPELDYLAVTVLGVAGSFLLGALVVRIPGAARIL
jgi:hypothetical protein